MEYEIVSFEERTVVGISARTNNASPEMTTIIGRLWNDFFNKGFYAGIENKTNNHSLGIYTNYQSDATGDYDIMTACEVTKVQNLKKDEKAITLPAGKYAKFTVKGDMSAVSKAWQQIWQLNLDRTYIADYEEYLDNNMTDQATILIYIGIK